MAAVADLVLFDERNPRSLVYQLDRLREGIHSLSGASGSSRAERMIEEIGARLRRMDPADLEVVDGLGNRAALESLLTGTLAALSELSEVITSTHLTLPGDMQPIWGSDQSRVLP